MLGKRLTLALLLITALLAGCIGGEGADDLDAATAPAATSNGDPAAGEAGTEGVLEAPTWQVGKFWTYKAQGIGEYTYVVTSKQGGDWIIGTDNPSLAFFHELSEVSMMGKIRTSDLAGSQNDTRVKFFDFPLEEGKSWTTTWDGAQRTITVTALEDEVATMESRAQDGTIHVRYEYDATTGFFGASTFHDGNGTPAFEASVVDAGTNFTGDAVRWRLAPALAASSGYSGVPEVTQGSFEVPEGLTDIWVSAQVHCPEGEVAFGIAPEEEAFGLAPGSENGWGVSGTCPIMASFAGPVATEPAAGTWSWGYEGLSPTQASWYDLTVLFRTLETVPIGSA